MCDVSKLETSMSVDLKKYALRLHKSCFRMLGEPKYIQLLVNPGELVVAVRAVSQELPRDSIHKINSKRMNSENSYEIYSRSFVRKLCQVIGGLDEGYSYRMIGRVFPKEGTAVFSLRSMQKITHVQETQP